ncbi:hypothetical protein V5T82_10935 [Magnetovibrio sp. PR-2]|uniref:hypothetical protein n=1 Tax=Magnetovibrio sp. PR-2 TaxID=3120356 RepID=UPI002FCE390E
MGGTETMVAMSAISMMQQSQQQKKVQKKAQQQYEQRAQAQANALKRQHDAEVRQEEDRLKRQTASHRARMAAGGVAPDDGSSGAVLEGLESTSRDQLNDRRAEYSSALSQLGYARESLAPTTTTKADHLNTVNSTLAALQSWG